MKRIVFAFVHKSDAEVKGVGMVLSKQGQTRMLGLQRVLQQLDDKSLGRIKICTESLNYSNRSADFFSKLNGINFKEVKFYCGVCNELRTITALFVSLCETLIFFDEVGSQTLLAEYHRVMEEYGLVKPDFSEESYRLGLITAVVINLEKNQVRRIMVPVLDPTPAQ